MHFLLCLQDLLQRLVPSGVRVVHFLDFLGGQTAARLISQAHKSEVRRVAHARTVMLPDMSAFTGAKIVEPRQSEEEELEET